MNDDPKSESEKVSSKYRSRRSRKRGARAERKEEEGGSTNVLSTIIWSNLIPAASYSLATSAQVRRKRPSPSFMMLALWTQVTFYSRRKGRKEKGSQFGHLHTSSLSLLLLPPPSSALSHPPSLQTSPPTHPKQSSEQSCERTFLPFFNAKSNANLAILSEPFLVEIFKLSTTPG